MITLNIKKRVIIRYINTLIWLFAWLFIWNNTGFVHFETLGHEFGHCLFSGIIFTFPKVNLDGTGYATTGLRLFGDAAAGAGGVLGCMFIGGLMQFCRSGFIKGMGLAFIFYNYLYVGTLSTWFKSGACIDMADPDTRLFVLNGMPLMLVICLLLFLIGILFNLYRDLIYLEKRKMTLFQKIIASINDFQIKQNKKVLDEINDYTNMYKSNK